MLAIVRFFLLVMLVSCVTIWPIYAAQPANITLDMPVLVIDLSPIAATLFVQQAQLGFLLVVVGVFLCFVATLLISRPAKQKELNQGNILANQVFRRSLGFLLILIMGLAVPALRILL